MQYESMEKLSKEVKKLKRDIKKIKEENCIRDDILELSHILALKHQRAFLTLTGNRNKALKIEVPEPKRKNNKRILKFLKSK